MFSSELPPYAAWRFVDAVDGFEVMYAEPGRLRGHTSAVEDGQAYAVSYEITLDDRWRTREVRVSSDTVAGTRSTVLLSDGDGRWTVDGVPAPHLDGLVDVDLEASACTNTLPVHRLDAARRRGHRCLRRLRPGARPRRTPPRPDLPSTRRPPLRLLLRGRLPRRTHIRRVRAGRRLPRHRQAFRLTTGRQPPVARSPGNHFAEASHLAPGKTPRRRVLPQDATPQRGAKRRLDPVVSRRSLRSLLNQRGSAAHGLV